MAEKVEGDMTFTISAAFIDFAFALFIGFCLGAWFNQGGEITKGAGARSWRFFSACLVFGGYAVWRVARWLIGA